MAVVKKKMIVENKSGLHARPAALFVQTASRFDADISVTKGKQEVNGKSIMGIMMLAAGKGSYICIQADGEDAQEAVDELEGLLNRFAEEEASRERKRRKKKTGR